MCEYTIVLVLWKPHGKLLQATLKSPSQLQVLRLKPNTFPSHWLGFIRESGISVFVHSVTEHLLASASDVSSPGPFITLCLALSSVPGLRQEGQTKLRLPINTFHLTSGLSLSVCNHYWEIVNISCNSPTESIQFNGFSYIRRAVKPSAESFLGHFHHLKKKPYNIPSPQVPQPKRTNNQLSVSLDLPILGIFI